MSKALDPVTAYATDVVKGKAIAGRLVRLACQRHLDDLKHARTRGLVWKPEEAQLAIDFFGEVLCLPEETAADDMPPEDTPIDGTPFVLSPWQAFIVGSLMGWHDKVGYTRFRVAYIEGAKGCGKTPLGAGLLLYLLVARGDRGAQLFVAAVGKDQAKIAFADAEKMVDASPALRELVDKKVNNLSVLETGSFLRAISSEKRGLDGKRISGAMIDELHEHATPVVANKIRKGTKGRRNAIVIETTNSGFDRTSVCWHHREYSQKVLEGTLHDDAWFAYICGLDACPACLADGKQFPQDDCQDCDDWRTEGPHWVKANPNLGVSLPWKYLRELVHQAKGMPSAVSDLLRFNFCVWTQSQSRFIDMGKWHACPVDVSADDLIDALCYGGLDLGMSDDLCAFLIVWVLKDGRIALKVWFWLPEKALEKYPNRPYDEWKRGGNLTVTEGDTVDYTEVETTVGDLCLEHGVLECAFDKRFALQMAQNLQGRGITMVDTPQGFQLNEALNKLTKLVVDGDLCHGNNPILTLMASNAVVRHGRDKQIRLDKEKSADKIDGMSALAMALARVVAREPGGGSVYETRGVASV
jgi:phage terminase large subunit-like protein